MAYNPYGGYNNYNQPNQANQIDTQISQVQGLLSELNAKKQQMQYQQPQQMQQPQQQYQEVKDNTSNVDWILVGAVDEAERIVVNQGQKRWFMFKSLPIIGVKEVNELGVPNMEYYELTPYNPRATQEQKIVEQKEVDLIGYVKIEEIEKLQLEISNLKSKVDSFEVKKQSTRKEVSANVSK